MRNGYGYHHGYHPANLSNSVFLANSNSQHPSAPACRLRQAAALPRAPLSLIRPKSTANGPDCSWTVPSRHPLHRTELLVADMRLPAPDPRGTPRVGKCHSTAICDKDTHYPSRDAPWIGASKAKAPPSRLVGPSGALPWCAVLGTARSAAGFLRRSLMWCSLGRLWPDPMSPPIGRPLGSW